MFLIHQKTQESHSFCNMTMLVALYEILTVVLFDDSLSFRLRSVDCNRGLSYSPCGPACPPVPGALHPAASAHHGLPEGASVCTNTRIPTGPHF